MTVLRKDSIAEGHPGLERSEAHKDENGTLNVYPPSSPARTRIPIFPPLESDYRVEEHMRYVAAAAAAANSVALCAAQNVTMRGNIAEDDQGLELSKVAKVESGTQTSPPVVKVGGVPTASSSAKSRITVKEVVKWFSEGRKPSKLSVLHNSGKSLCSKFWKSSSHEKQTLKSPQLIQGSTKSEKIQTGLQEIRPKELQRLEDHQYVALAKRDLQQLEVEIKFCCRDNAGLHGRVRQEMESVIQEALQTIKHGGDMDINQAIEYNEELLSMQQKFEDLTCSLQKAKVDLASVRKVCVQMRCRCWWCRGCSGLRQLTSMHRNNLKIRNKHQRRGRSTGRN